MLPPLASRPDRAAARPSQRRAALRRPRPRPGGLRARDPPRARPTEPQLDAFEVQLAREADARGLPILGICRGAQALNVARGGTLHQHIPELTDGSIAHRQREPGTQVTHEVRIATRSDLRSNDRDSPSGRQLVSPSERRPARRGLRAVAWADDGIDRGHRGIAGLRSCSEFNGMPRRSSTIPLSLPSSDAWSQSSRGARAPSPTPRIATAARGLSDEPARSDALAQLGATGRLPR